MNIQRLATPVFDGDLDDLSNTDSANDSDHLFDDEEFDSSADSDDDKDSPLRLTEEEITSFLETQAHYEATQHTPQVSEWVSRALESQRELVANSRNKPRATGIEQEGLEQAISEEDELLESSQSPVTRTPSAAKALRERMDPLNSGAEQSPPAGDTSAPALCQSASPLRSSKPRTAGQLGYSSPHSAGTATGHQLETQSPGPRTFVRRARDRDIEKARDGDHDPRPSVGLGPLDGMRVQVAGMAPTDKLSASMEILDWRREDHDSREQHELNFVQHPQPVRVLHQLQALHSEAKELAQQTAAAREAMATMSAAYKAAQARLALVRERKGREQARIRAKRAALKAKLLEVEGMRGMLRDLLHPPDPVQVGTAIASGFRVFSGPNRTYFLSPDGPVLLLSEPSSSSSSSSSAPSHPNLRWHFLVTRSESWAVGVMAAAAGERPSDFLQGRAGRGWVCKGMLQAKHRRRLRELEMGGRWVEVVYDSAQRKVTAYVDEAWSVVDTSSLQEPVRLVLCTYQGCFAEMIGSVDPGALPAHQRVSAELGFAA